MIRVASRISLVVLLAGCAVEYTVTSDGGTGTGAGTTAGTASSTGAGATTNTDAGGSGGQDCPDPEEIRCGNRCIDPQEDPDHCGECGHACAPDHVCDDGECKPEDDGGTDEDDGRTDGDDGGTDGDDGGSTHSDETGDQHTDSTQSGGL